MPTLGWSDIQDEEQRKDLLDRTLTALKNLLASSDLKGLRFNYLISDKDLACIKGVYLTGSGVLIKEKKGCGLFWSLLSLLWNDDGYSYTYPHSDADYLKMIETYKLTPRDFHKMRSKIREEARKNKLAEAKRTIKPISYNIPTSLPSSQKAQKKLSPLTTETETRQVDDDINWGWEDKKTTPEPTVQPGTSPGLDIYNLGQHNLPNNTSFKKLDYLRHRINEEMKAVRDKIRYHERGRREAERSFSAERRRMEKNSTNYKDLLSGYERMGPISGATNFDDGELTKLRPKLEKLQKSLDYIHSLMDQHKG